MCFTIRDERDYSALIVKDAVFIRHQAQAFKNLVRELAKKGKNNIILDMSGCEYISSEGLGAVAETWHGSRERGGLFCVVCQNKAENEIRYLFDIIGFSVLLQGFIFDTLDDAIARVTNRPPA
ncbi:MAG: hypothetical protein A2350_06525 [Candidatus Raymondbacteria bacterium RifOxyB12_full_50_8]|nr:MAG: hypothetical protein A2350_06525 [Candidatus Raymondbacteria bacterium RifOxyB12_full_50_8]